MSQGPLCLNLSQKVQAEVSQMANRNLSRVILLGGLSVNLNHLKISYFCTGFHLTIFRLSPENLFDLLTHLRPFQIQLEMKTKCQFAIEPSTTKKFEMNP